MPGKIVGINLKEGDAVTGEEIVFIMEAMKMEHPLRAPTQGSSVAILVDVKCGVGDIVGEGTVLAYVEVSGGDDC